MFNRLPHNISEQSGAVEACWAHNPEVRGSKPRSANIFSLHETEPMLVIPRNTALKPHPVIPGPRSAVDSALDF